MRNLSEAELRTLCDWAAAATGGYGHLTDCGGGLMIATSPNQQSCVAELDQTPTCTATVQDAMTCAQRFAQNPCDLAGPLSLAECMALLTCD